MENGFSAILVSKEPVGKHKVTKEMIEKAPCFPTVEEAEKYCDMINPDYLWAIMPTKDIEYDLPSM